MKFLRKFFQIASLVLGSIALLFLAFIMVATTLDVSLRGVLGVSISGAFEVSEVSLALIVFLGLGWAQIDDAHIRVTILRDRLSSKHAMYLDSFAWAVASIVLILIAMPATAEAAHSFNIREFRWGAVQMPIWWVKVAIAGGLWFGAAQMAFNCIDNLFKKPSWSECSSEITSQ